jgi:hypothetical protein
MKIEITPHHYLELAKKAYSLDMIYLLTLLSKGFDIEPLCNGSARVKNVAAGLLRKGLITEKGISVLGKEVLKFTTTDEGTVLAKKKVSLEIFDVWWKAYPGTDNFRHKNRTFKGSRSLRGNKQKCRDKFNAIVNEGEYTGHLLIEAMLLDVLQKKEASVKANSNKLSYMQNSMTYPNQRSYEGYIELIQSGADIEGSTKAKEIDI